MDTRSRAEEIEFHRSLKEHEHRTSGVPVESARKQMGNLTLAKEESRDLWSF